MKERYCATGRVECPHLPQCVWECQHGTPIQDRRKVKPYPAVPDDIDPLPEQWHTMGKFVIGAIMAALATICILIFFTGVWLWSLLI